MSSTDGKHSEGFQVLFYHLDRNGRASLRAMMNFMQAAANMHGKTMGTSVDDLAGQSFTWVFSRFHIRFLRYPEHYEKITVKTWRTEGPKSFFAHREFQVFDESGHQIGEASTMAVLIDKKTRKPVGIPEFIKAQFIKDPERAIEDPFLPLPVLAEEEAGSVQEKAFHVRMSDIDLNQHVNNTSYAEWIVESLPESVLAEKRLISCEIAYRAEALYGDTVRSISAEANASGTTGNPVFNHRLIRQEDGKEITTARTEWVEN